MQVVSDITYILDITGLANQILHICIYVCVYIYIFIHTWLLNLWHISSESHGITLNTLTESLSQRSSQNADASTGVVDEVLYATDTAAC